MLNDEEVKKVEVMDTEAKQLFLLWWNCFGRKVETLCQSAVMREEIASYAFVAGFDAGRRKKEQEKE